VLSTPELPTCIATAGTESDRRRNDSMVSRPSPYSFSLLPNMVVYRIERRGLPESKNKPRYCKYQDLAVKISAL